MFGVRSSVACYYCRLPQAEAIEHVHPRKRGGDNEETNLAPICTHCNSSKGSREAPKTPPRGYSGKWPPPWWPTRMQVWYVLQYGPPVDWTLEKRQNRDNASSGETELRIPPGSRGGNANESVLDHARKRIFAVRQAVNCMYCGMARATAVEHVWPRVRGGDNEESNLGPSCALCNSSKGDGLAPQNPPHDYVGKWPPPWWPTRLQVWFVREFGEPSYY